jgi:ferredoxin
MPRFVFEGNDLGPAVSADVEEGGRVLDVCDAAHAPVLFSCRSATCGTCRIDVIEGGDLLDAPGQDERFVLELFESPPTCRLACQAAFRPGLGLIRIRWIND